MPSFNLREVRDNLKIFDKGQNSNIFIKCECHSEAIECEYQPLDKEFHFSYWKYGFYNRPLKFKEKIRWCWNILKTGKPWVDFVIVAPENAKKLADYIQERVKNV